MSAGLTVNWQHDQMRILGNAFAALGEKKTHDALRRALNHSGDKAKTQVIRALTTQTGLKRKVIVKAVKAFRANYGRLSYEMKTQGGDIRLKYFGAKEGGGGVTANPWGKQHFYAGVFIKSGRKPRRASKLLGGHAYRNVSGGKWGGTIEVARSGLFIPEEMVKGATESAFYASVDSTLPERIAHEVYRLLPGG